LREQDGVTEKREKRGAGEKGKRRLDRETMREREKRKTHWEEVRRHGSAVQLSIMVLSVPSLFFPFVPLG